MSPRPRWQTVARRIRVPLGFVLAAAYLWLAQPTWESWAIGAVLVAAGLGIRAAASGHVRKDAILTTTGPYAYVRHPLYLGSLVMAAGFLIAARSLWLAAAMGALFFFIYLPVMRQEESYLRANFPAYDEYARAVPGLLPWRGRWRATEGGAFSWELYRKHREYQALLGATAMLAVLILKLVW
jgi:protein-S-isoprenylcysteine O-methyltransferase Ste14